MKEVEGSSGEEDPMKKARSKAAREELESCDPLGTERERTPRIVR